MLSSRIEESPDRWDSSGVSILGVSRFGTLCSRYANTGDWNVWLADSFPLAYFRGQVLRIGKQSAALGAIFRIGTSERGYEIWHKSGFRQLVDYAAGDRIWIVETQSARPDSIDRIEPLWGDAVLMPRSEYWQIAR